MNTITRRTALAGAAALPLLPATALAMALPAERDPVVSAFEDWQRHADECDRLADVFGELEARHGISSDEAVAYEDETVRPAHGRKAAVEDRISQMVATTPAGLVGQLTIAMAMVGLIWGKETGNTEDRLRGSMLTGAKRMAAEGA